MKSCYFAFCCIWLASAAYAFRVATPQGSAVSLKQASEFNWNAFPELAAGAQYHLVREDPETRAIQKIVRLRAKTSVPEHTHTHDVTILVLKGKLHVVIGKTLEETLTAGSYAVIPDGTPHQIRSKTRLRDCWILMTTNAPFDLKRVTAVSP